MTPEELVARHPRLYHFAARDSWPSIQRHGLLSTAALLDLFEIRGERRARLLSQRRPRSERIVDAARGIAVVRDQRPLHENVLVRALDGMTPREWYELLNSMVFFWPTSVRLESMKAAYAREGGIVLTVRTSDLVRAHEPSIRLSRINSGSATRRAARRGRDTFVSIASWPARERIAELTVEHSVTAIANMIERIDEMRPLNA